MNAPPHVAIFGFGYLGEALGEAFSAAGWRVSCASLSGGGECFACDLGDAASMQSVASRVVRPDLIIHCASSGRGGPEAYRRVYCNGVSNLQIAFPDVPILFTSSTSVYGQTDGLEVDENSDTVPDRETSRLLLKAERSVLNGGGIVARLSGIYGPGRSSILQKFLSGDAVIEEDGRRYLNQIHRDDIAAAILHLATRRTDFAGSIFNVSDSHPLTQRECYEALAKQFDRQLPPAAPRDLNRKRGWTHKRVSNAKLRATGWEPKFPSFLDAAPAIAGTL